MVRQQRCVPEVDRQLRSRPPTRHFAAALGAVIASLACVALLCAGLAGEADAARRKPRKEPAPAAAPWPDPQPLPMHRFTLDNGLRVVVQPDPSAPLVAIGLMVDVGSRDEVEGRSGLAHFFEHMMFQGSAHVGKMEHFTALEAVGADLNANTSADRTYYYETVPKGALELALWLEYDRFSALQIDADNVENQRKTVMEERRQRYDNQPYAQSRLVVLEQLFSNWQLGHSTIGSMADLAATPLEDFVAFWRRWYTPNNVVLALVGDITEAEARAVLAKTLGKLPRRAEVDKQRFSDPPREQHSYTAFEEKRGKMPAFHLAYKVPAAPHADALALDLLAEVLDGGRSSRLETRLGRQTGLASRHFAGTYGRRDVDVFHIYVELSRAGEADFNRAKAIVRDEIADIAVRGVDADELVRARVAFEAGWVFAKESAEARAETLCRFELYEGDASRVNSVLQRYRAVTSEDLQRVARAWLRWDNEVEVDVLPTGTPTPKGAGEKPSGVAKAEARLAAAIERAERERAKEAAAAAAREAAAKTREEAALRKAEAAERARQAREAKKAAAEARRAEALAKRQAAAEARRAAAEAKRAAAQAKRDAARAAREGGASGADAGGGDKDGEGKDAGADDDEPPPAPPDPPAHPLAPRTAPAPDAPGKDAATPQAAEQGGGAA